MGVFSLSSAQPIQPTQIQANINENETHVFVEIVNLDLEKTINGYAVLTTLDGSSKIQSFSVPPKTKKIVISIKKPEKKGTALAEIFLDENQRQIVLTREITLTPSEKTLPTFPLSQNYILITVAVIGMITIIGMLIVIKIKSQPPGQW